MHKPLKIGLAQMSPVWLDRARTLSKCVDWVNQAAQQSCQLLVFSEALVPGYPFWLEWTGGASFNDERQKRLFAHYAEQAVCLEKGDLKPLCEAAAAASMTLVVGIIERPLDRGGHSLYASVVTIGVDGVILNVHRKLQPTYEERLVWSPGDGQGLRCMPVGDFTMGTLNCWENWMPLARAALYDQGENLHIAIWPGSRRNTFDLTPVLAKEARSYVVSVGAPFHRDLIPDMPDLQDMRDRAGEWLADGGSCLAAPDGSWLIEPTTHKEALLTATVSMENVLRERQNFDPSGHYSRPDVTQLTVNRRRQSTLNLVDPPNHGP